MATAFHYNVTFNHANALIEVFAGGQALPHQIIALYDDIEQQLTRSGYDKVLLETFTLTLAYAPDKVIEITERLSESFSQTRLARLVNLADYKNDLIETFATRHHLQIKSFTDRNAAVTWLNAHRLPEVELS